MTFMILNTINDYETFREAFFSLLSAFINVVTGLVTMLFEMEYFGLNMGKLIFAVLIFMAIIYSIINYAMRNGG